MAWQNESVILLRSLINDFDTPQKYTDDRLLTVLLVGAFQLGTAARFSQNFRVNLEQQTLTPDPTDTQNSTDDNFFMNLMCLKAACIIDTGSAIKAANAAISGKDMDTTFDLKGVATSTLALLQQGYCATFSAAFDAYLDGNGAISACVTGPFRIRARNNYYIPGFLSALRNF